MYADAVEVFSHYGVSAILLVFELAFASPVLTREASADVSLSLPPKRMGICSFLALAIVRLSNFNLVTFPEPSLFPVADQLLERKTIGKKLVYKCA